MLPGLDGLKLRRNPENYPINNVCPSPVATHKTQVKMLVRQTL